MLAEVHECTMEVNEASTNCTSGTVCNTKISLCLTLQNILGKLFITLMGTHTFLDNYKL